MPNLRAPLLGAVLAMGFVVAAAAAPALKITVYGGTGNIGQRIVHEALERGDLVTIIAREPDAMERNPRLTFRKGDVLDPAQVAQAAAGQDVIVSAVSFRKPPDPEAYVRAAKSLVSALRGLGPKAPRLIVVGGAGSLIDQSGKPVVERIPVAFRGEVLGQKDALDYYRTVKDVSWTYFSPAFSITPGTRTGQFRLGGDRLIVDAQGNSRISMEDYAVAVLNEAEKPAHVHQRFTIGY
ncbi:MAG: NAD(P)H-binding protein [Acetobacteraceae bacterium]|nr:NAD(P)H-binding protein [Acetobacteraceae bacterium]